MNTRRLIAIDHLVARPIAWGFVGAAWALGKVLRRNHHVDPDRVKTIVVAKLVGMGSIIQATPFLTSIRRAFPNAKILFLTSIANRGLVERLDCIDEGLYLRDHGLDTLSFDVATTCARFATTGVDLYFDLELYSAGASILALMSLARNRYGFYRHSARFKKGNYTHLVFFNVQMPVSRLYLQLYTAATKRSPTLPLEFGPIRVTPEDISRMRDDLGALGLGEGEPYVVVNPNASELLLERRWPAHKFVGTIEELTAMGHRVVLIGSPGEAHYVRRIHEALSPVGQHQCIDSSGKLSLGSVFALIHQASCVITNDTGPMHIAIAMSRPTVCLFGPGSPEHYGVRGPKVDIRYKAVVCSPCLYETDAPPCDGKNICMQIIEVDEVVNAAVRLMRDEDHGTVSRRSLAPVEAPVNIWISAGK